MSAEDQSRLLRRLQHGDAEAFRDLVHRHSGMVYGVCHRILGNPSDAEDAAQEAGLRPTPFSTRARASR